MSALTRRTAALAIALAATLAVPLAAQDAGRDDDTPNWEGRIEPVSGFTGQMSMTMESEVPEDMAIDQVIRFEPWQMLDELFRDDLVFLMRSGPTDWSVADDPASGPQDCERQRLLSEEGQDRMRQLGALLIVNDLRPGAILTSRWCRAQQTYLGLETGMVDADRDALDGMTADISEALDPVTAAQGAPDVSGLQDLILGWDGGDGDGPLLLVTEFENIAELTRFNVYEGEMLIVDPKRELRVLGYLRLGSAMPDLVHFPEDVVAYARSQRAISE